MPHPRQKTVKPTRPSKTRATSMKTKATKGTKRKAVEPTPKATKVQRTGHESKAKVGPSKRKEVQRVSVSGANDTALLPGDTLGVGNSNFEEMVKAKFSVIDKSMLIAEFADAGDKVSLVLRPRRFGKSTNLSMLRLFFERIDGESKSERESRRALFGGMKIANERPELLDNAFGKYPVIYLSLKDISGKTWDEMLIDIRTTISKVYAEHRYLQEHLQDEEIIKFDRIVREDPSYPTLRHALGELSEYLARYHQQKCIVLIDEYDAPIGAAYHKGYYDDAMDFFRPMFSSLLKDNINLHKAFLVGVLRVGKSGFLSGLNNISVYPMTHPQFASSFGFTSDEVELLLTHHSVNTPLENVMNWYNGYNIGEDDTCYSIFNPWSIINLCKDRVLRPFWCESGGTTTIENHLSNASQKFKEAVSDLVDRKPIKYILSDNMSYGDLAAHDDRALWTLLYYAGYLTIRDGQFVVPNSEVYMQWVDWIVPALSNPGEVEDLLKSLVSGDVEKFKREFESLTMECLSFHDVGGSESGKKAEVFYHAFCLGLFVALQRRGYNVRSNREAGLGRFDVRAEPKLRGALPGIVMELKVARENNNLDTLAQMALDQIIEKQYWMGISDDVKKILLFGIAFEGKKSCIVTETINRD